MKKEKIVDFTLFSNYETPSYEDYKDMCEGNEWEVHEEGSSEYWDVINTMEQIDWEDFEYSIKHSNLDHLVVIGSCGTWRGNIEIMPKHFDNLYDAVLACLNNCDYYEIKYNDGTIEVRSSHHDGTNHFEIKKLNYLGLKEYDADRLEYKTAQDWMFRKIKIEEIE